MPFTCTRCGNTRAGFERPPFPGAIGARIVQEICQDCWAQWVRQQTMLINHYGLNVMDPQARAFLTKNLEAGYLGQFQIEKREIRHISRIAASINAITEEVVESFLAVFGDDQFVCNVSLGERSFGQSNVARIVFHQQNRA